MMLLYTTKYKYLWLLVLRLDAQNTTNCLMLSLHILTSTVEFHGKREGAPPTEEATLVRSFHFLSSFPLRPASQNRRPYTASEWWIWGTRNSVKAFVLGIFDGFSCLSFLSSWKIGACSNPFYYWFQLLLCTTRKTEFGKKGIETMKHIVYCTFFTF